MGFLFVCGGECFFFLFVCFVKVFLLWFICFVFVVKGAWWMPWHAKPMKDVEGCVKPRGVVN